MKSAALRTLLLAASLLVLPNLAQAQAFDAVRLFGVPEGDGEGSVGVVAISAYEYMGSDERRMLFVPSIDYRWKNGWFAGASNGIGYLFPSKPYLQYGLRVTADLGRRDSRSDALTGMGDIEVRPEASVFLNVFPSRQVFLTSSIRYGSGNDRNGLQLDLGAGYWRQFAPKWRGALGVAATYVNGDYMQEFFGVTPEQALATGYAAYEPGSGLRDVRFTGSLNYLIDDRWSVTGAVTMSSLQGDAGDSPIVFETTPVSAVMAVSYSF